MLRRIIWICITLFPLLASAATLTSTCTAPTKFTDGTSITSPIAYKFYGALQGQPKTLLTTTAVTSCNHIWTITTTGTYCVEATAIAMGQESAHTPESCKLVTATQSPPDPPSGLVTGASTAYEFRTGATPLALVGLVRKGIPCGPATQTINGALYCEVPKVAVDVVVWPTNLAVTQLWARAVTP